MTRTLAAALARFMLRTAGTPFGAVWGIAYRSVMAAAVSRLRREYPDAAIYLKGSFASGEAVYGISDVDLVVVLTGDAAHPGATQLAARENWKQLCERRPLFKLVIQHCWFYEQDDLRKSTSAPCLTYGQEPDHLERDDRAVFLGPNALSDHMGLQTRPILYGARTEWKNLAGRDRLPAARGDDPQSRRLAAWLDLQYWWRHAFLACADPNRAHVPLLCVKLIAEPVRLWLWAGRGERLATREDVLLRALSELPEEREALQLGLDLLKALPRSSRAPLSEAIAALLRNTERLARHMNASADAAGYLDVRLTGTDDVIVTQEMRNRMDAFRSRGWSPEILPLADWRARAVPGLPDEAMLLIDTNEVNPRFIAAAARSDGRDAVTAFRYHSVMLFPTVSSERGVLRAVQCQATDPVSAALADGHVVARFPELAGWSALHSARRAVAEHLGWLESDGWALPPHGWVGMQSGPGEPKVRTLGLLFTAARAALFLESIVDGAPELAVTVAGVAERLIARDSTCRDAVEQASGDFRALHGDEQANRHSVAAMLEVVRNLPAYAGSQELAMGVR